MNQFDKFLFIVDCIYVDDEKDLKLLKRKIQFFLKKLNREKRRMLVYIFTEPVIKVEGENNG